MGVIAFIAAVTMSSFTQNSSSKSSDVDLHWYTTNSSGSFNISYLGYQSEAATINATGCPQEGEFFCARGYDELQEENSPAQASTGQVRKVQE